MPLVALREGPVRPAPLSGRRGRQRRALGIALIAFLVAVPWIPVGGLPAVQIDIPGRQLILLGAIFTPHDTWALALLLLAAVLTLFLVTAVLGRVWCGWACPQTVWLDHVFRPIQRLFEGPAHRARKRDKGPRDARWWARKIGMQLAFLAVSVVVTAVFLSWFVGGPAMVRGEIGGTGLVIALALTGLFYADFAWFREQMCHYACPYARFQGVLMGPTSLTVAYDGGRGEPRTRKKAAEGGDCIDCNQCVAACPMGIDIRDGDQLQCVACAACADACDDVMIKIGRPNSLIRYTTQGDAPASPGEGRPVFSRRAAVYAALLAVVLGTLIVGMGTRSEVAVAVARIPTAELYQLLPDGRIANRLSVHISNRDSSGHGFRVEPLTPGAELAVPGLPGDIPLGGESRLPGFVTAPAEAFEGGRLPVRFQIVRDDGVAVDAELTMLGPG